MIFSESVREQMGWRLQGRALWFVLGPGLVVTGHHWAPRVLKDPLRIPSTRDLPPVLPTPAESCRLSLLLQGMLGRE